MTNTVKLMFLVLFAFLIHQDYRHKQFVKVVDQELSDQKLRIAYLEGGDQ